MSKKRKAAQTDDERSEKRAVVGKLVVLVVISAVIFAFYRFMLTTPYFAFVLAAYLTAMTVLIAVYIIYNRGMTRKGITEDMLPDEWSREKREEFIEDGKRRMKSSSWMLMLILAFLFTFTMDLVELYVVPFLETIVSA